LSETTTSTSKNKKKKKKKSNYYFTAETQQKIVEYQKLDHKRRRDQIYSGHIQPAFEELVHNLVSVYQFKSAIEDINHLKHDCVTFLYETIPKWKPDNGTKAFSYFNVVAKNWLTIHSRRHYKHARRSVNIDCKDDFTSYEKEQLNRIEPDVAKAYEVNIDQETLVPMLMEMTNRIRHKLKDQRDLNCVDAIQQIFDNVDDLDFLNKRAVFVYLREISGLNSTELSASLSNIRKHFRKMSGPDTEFYLF
tara:strand:- start:597 stop:1343 length:747 start_codon:yes stop_codon:yes gene_type:complete